MLLSPYLSLLPKNHVVLPPNVAKFARDELEQVRFARDELGFFRVEETIRSGLDVGGQLLAQSRGALTSGQTLAFPELILVPFRAHWGRMRTKILLVPPRRSFASAKYTSISPISASGVLPSLPRPCIRNTGVPLCCSCCADSTDHPSMLTFS